MRVINKTRYHTQDVKNIMLDVLKEEGVSHRGYEVTLVYRRERVIPEKFRDLVKREPSHIAGYAYINRPVIRMKLPKKEFIKEEFVEVFRHEVMHTLGVRHERGGCLMSRFYAPQPIDSASFVASFIQEPVVSACTPTQRYEIKLSLAVKNLNKANTRLKRAQTIQQKWLRRVKLYQRKVRS